MIIATTLWLLGSVLMYYAERENPDEGVQTEKTKGKFGGCFGGRFGCDFSGGSKNQVDGYLGGGNSNIFYFHPYLGK